MSDTADSTSWIRRLGWWGYRAAMATGLVTVGPILLARRRAHYLPTLRGRLGRWPDDEPPRRGGFWLHAVSVGEVGVAATLAQELPADELSVVTTVTPTGQAEAQRKLASRASIAYLPFDLRAPVERFFDRFRPRALILVEGDYWPLVLREASRRAVPVVVVNGRVGDRGFRRMRRTRRFLGPLFDAVTRFGVQTEDDASRLSALGVEPERIVVTGNLKYETPEPPPAPELEAALGRAAGGRPLVVAGSTMAGEDEQVLEAFRPLADRALLLLAPRHPERCDAVAELVAASGLRLVRRSALSEALDARPDVVLLDTVGELAALYRRAAAAFIGGTLVPTGGHNPLEAARWGVPVAVGPSMENFREMAADFDRREAWARVRRAADLGAAWRAWLDDPDAARELGERGRALVDANRGALARTIEMLRPILEAEEA